jgi:acylphosphatase
MAMVVRPRILIRGIVQGVVFVPPYIGKQPREDSGFIRNLSDGTVQIVVEGEPEAIEEFIDDVKKERSNLSRIDELKVLREPANYGFDSFAIEGSSSEGVHAGSIISI